MEFSNSCYDTKHNLTTYHFPEEPQHLTFKKILKENKKQNLTCFPYSQAC